MTWCLAHMQNTHGQRLTHQPPPCAFDYPGHRWLDHPTDMHGPQHVSRLCHSHILSRHAISSISHAAFFLRSCSTASSAAFLFDSHACSSTSVTFFSSACCCFTLAASCLSSSSKISRMMGAGTCDQVATWTSFKSCCEGFDVYVWLSAMLADGGSGWKLGRRRKFSQPKEAPTCQPVCP